MVAFIVGVVLIAFSVFAAVPAGLNWLEHILTFLQGAIPVFAAIIGLIAIFVGIADIKDKSEARKEEEASKRQEL